MRLTSAVLLAAALAAGGEGEEKPPTHRVAEVEKLELVSGITTQPGTVVGIEPVRAIPKEGTYKIVIWVARGEKRLVIEVDGLVTKTTPAEIVTKSMVSFTRASGGRVRVTVLPAGEVMGLPTKVVPEASLTEFFAIRWDDEPPRAAR